MKKLTSAVAIIVGLASPAWATDFSVLHESAVGNVRYLHVQTGDLDGDGVADMQVLKLVCAGGSVDSASIYAPRDLTTGQASGKRMHKPFTIVKEWGAASPLLMSAKATYDLKAAKGARTMAADDWSTVSVTGLDGACAGSPKSATR